MADEADRFARFQAAYSGSEPPPWDSGIVPPELRALVEGELSHVRGGALDVGCGTGVSSLYLAAQGWQVTGVDWVAEALEMARARARAAGHDPSNPRFLLANVGSPDFLPNQPPLALWLDVGCLHGLPPAAHQHYAAHAVRLVAPGGTLLLYAFGPTDLEGQSAGLAQADVVALFGRAFDLLNAVHGREATDETRPSGWYTLRRRE